jgi:hypothetical protein
VPVGITTIQHEELEEISNESIGNGVFGSCFLKKFIRLGITVVEKQLIDSTADMLYKEAIFMQKFRQGIGRVFFFSCKFFFIKCSCMRMIFYINYGSTDDTNIH